MIESGPLNLVTRRVTLGLFSGGLATIASIHRVLATSTEERVDLNAIFLDSGFTGTFVLYDVSNDHITLVNPKRAETRFIPASAFKIANSLIALETRVVKDENEIIPYGGQLQPVKQWEKDMSMREAIAISNVAVYKELARRIGLDRYRIWLDRLDYGNRQTGTALESFWLSGPLEISAVEQAIFVARLALQKLDISARAQSIVRNILRLPNADGPALYGKTGWSSSSNPSIGWWTGWVEGSGKIFSFALNVAASEMLDGPRRLAIGRSLLTKLGVL